MSTRPGPGLKILLIEDELVVREVITDMLAALGHQVLAVDSGEKGLGRLASGESVDIVLTDLKMPGMSGWEVLQAIKARWPHLPAGIITGTPELLQEQREPVDVVMRKPIRLDALREAIGRLRPS